MATLKQLLDNGLKVGALVKIEGEIYQFKGKEDFKHTAKDCYYVFVSVNYKTEAALFADTSIDFQLTTAYDCCISPDSLPIPEPVDVTGWVVVLHEQYKFKPISFHDKMAENIWNETYEWGDCRACLPPA